MPKPEEPITVNLASPACALLPDPSMVCAVLGCMNEPAEFWPSIEVLGVLISFRLCHEHSDQARAAWSKEHR